MIAAFAYKIDPYTNSSLLPILTFASLAVMLFLQIRRSEPESRNSLTYRTMWLSFAVSSVFAALVATNQLASIDFRSVKGSASQIADSAVTVVLEMVGFRYVKIAQIGNVEAVEGMATVMRADGQRVILSSGSAVFERDMIETGPDAAIAVSFLDGTTLNVSERSELVLDEYVNERGALDQGLYRETLRFVGGTLSTRAPFRKLHLNGVDLTGISLGRKNMRNANLAGSNLSGVDLAGHDLRGAILDRTILQGSDLSDANLSDVQAVGAVLTNGILPNAELEGADLSGASLAGANLRTTNLRRASFIGADFEGTNFQGADLRGANLSDARNLKQSQLDEACGDHRTQLPAGLQLERCSGFVPFKIQTPTATIGIRG